jgi:uncharacterized sporulation protein YeaH/YhbH (DUF444 family)
MLGRSANIEMVTRRRASEWWLPTRAVACITAAALVVGCGGDSDLSREEFVAQADEVCRQSSGEFARIQRTPPTSAEQAEKQMEALIDVERQALGDLQDLEPPEGLRSRYEHYLQARERALGFLEDGREAAASNDPHAYNAAKRKAASEQAQRLQLARLAGLRRCSRPALTLGSGA